MLRDCEAAITRACNVIGEVINIIQRKTEREREGAIGSLFWDKFQIHVIRQCNVKRHDCNSNVAYKTGQCAGDI